MHPDAFLGIILLSGALLLILGLVLWSRHSIERVARKDLKSAREIVKDRVRV